MCSGSHVDNVIVPDQAHSRGTTVPGKGLAESIQQAEAAGATGPEIDALEKEWLEQHPLVTFNEGAPALRDRSFTLLIARG